MGGKVHSKSVGLDIPKLDVLPDQMLRMRKTSCVCWSWCLDIFYVPFFFFLMGLSPYPNVFDSIVELPEVPSSSSCPPTDQSRPAPKKASSFARCTCVICLQRGFDLVEQGAVRAGCVRLSAVRPLRLSFHTWPLPMGSWWQRQRGLKTPKFQAEPDPWALRTQATFGHPCQSHHLQPPG